ncbi:hypothetical protein BS78_05G289300 [Paspalum vaginatum]|nr:hypothetical protein BS78_05G289300 [Paspalum vaginatum]
MDSGKEQRRQQHHLVLVHGACHGAWCWYKVATVLSSAGHRVTALDMAACGASPQRTEEVPSFEEYSRPLLDVLAGLPPEEKAILVGHSFGGLSLALAMERNPDKVAVAVFVAAPMPAAGKPMDVVFQQQDSQAKEERPVDVFMDCKMETSSPLQIFMFGPQFMKKNLYQLSPPEDLTLAVAMVRRSRRFQDDAMLTQAVLTAERYGAVKKVCIVAEDDALLSVDIRRQMASWNPGTEVMVLPGADHMPMFSKARELSQLIMEIAHKYT